MPKIGLTIEEAEVIEWLVAVGDDVTAGQPLVLVNADKTELEIEAPTAGVLAAIRVDRGEVVAVGAVLGSIAGAGDDAPAEAAPPVPAPDAPAPVEPLPAPLPAGPTRGETGPSRIVASPYARRLAGVRGVELRRVRGSGPGGRIVARDVDAVLDPGEVSPPPSGFVRAVVSVRADRALALQRRVRVGGTPIVFGDIVIAALVAAAGGGRDLGLVSFGTLDSPQPAFAVVDVGAALAGRVPADVGALVSVASARDAAQRDGLRARPTGGAVVLDGTESAVERLDAELWDDVAVTVAIGSLESRPIAVRGQFQIGYVLTVTLVADASRWSSFSLVDLAGRLVSELEGIGTAA